MKKIITTVFAASFIFGLTACQNPNVAACDEGIEKLTKTYEDCGLELDESAFKCDAYAELTTDCTAVFDYWGDATCEGEGDVKTVKFPETAGACK